MLTFKQHTQTPKETFVNYFIDEYIKSIDILILGAAEICGKQKSY